jgi:hypothetical protein
MAVDMSDVEFLKAHDVIMDGAVDLTDFVFNLTARHMTNCKCDCGSTDHW